MQETSNKSDSLQRPEGRGFSPTLLMKPILIIYFSGGIREKDETETKDAIEGFRVSGTVQIINERWDTALQRLWTYEGDIIVMEHDVVPSIYMLYDMLKCPCVWCTQLYRLYPASTNLDHEVYGNRYLNEKGELIFKRADLSYTSMRNFCDAASLCFTKFTPAFRKQIDSGFFKDSTLDLVNLDHKISMQAIEKGIKCHVHYPEMRHNHSKIKNEWQGVKKLVL